MEIHSIPTLKSGSDIDMLYSLPKWRSVQYLLVGWLCLKDYPKWRSTSFLLDKQLSLKASPKWRSIPYFLDGWLSLKDSQKRRFTPLMEIHCIPTFKVEVIQIQFIHFHFQGRDRMDLQNGGPFHTFQMDVQVLRILQNEDPIYSNQIKSQV